MPCRWVVTTASPTTPATLRWGSSAEIIPAGERGQRLISMAERKMKFLRNYQFQISIMFLGCAFFCPNLQAKDKPPVQYQIPIPAAPDFAPLDWLQGNWTGKTLAPSPTGDLKLAVAPVLDKHFLITPR